MTKGHRTIVALLAVVAVLLGLNLIVNLPPQEAEAAPPWLPPPVDDTPTVVGMGLEGDNAWRVWSDGVMEIRRWDFVSGIGRCWPDNDWTTVPECP